MKGTTDFLFLFALCLALVSGGTWSKSKIVQGPPTASIQGVKVGDDGVPIVASIIGEDLFSFDPATGFTPLGLFPFGDSDDLELDGDWIYFTDTLAGLVRGYNTVTGELISLNGYDGNFVALPGANPIAKDPTSGEIFFAQAFLGDALWQGFTDGQAPLLLESNLGGLNGFDIDTLGRINGPLWDTQEMVRFLPTDFANRESIALPSNWLAASLSVSPVDGAVFAVIREIGYGSYLVSVDFDAGTYQQVLCFPDVSVDSLDVGPDGTIWISFDDGSMVHADPIAATSTTYINEYSSMGTLKASKVDRNRYYHSGGFISEVIEIKNGKAEVETTIGPLVQGDPMAHPSDMDVRGNLAVGVNVFSNILVTFDATTLAGLGIFPISSGTSVPSSVNFIDDENVLILDLFSGIHKMNAVTGVSELLHSVFGALRGVVKNNKLYYTMFYTGEIGILDIGSNTIRTVSPAGGLDSPDGIDVDSAGNIYVVEKGEDGRVLKLSGSDGRILDVIDAFLPAFAFNDGPLSIIAHGRGLALSSNGRSIYVTVPSKYAIYEYKKN